MPSEERQKKKEEEIEASNRSRREHTAAQKKGILRAMLNKDELQGASACRTARRPPPSPSPFIRVIYLAPDQ